jgi:hypothetical protein
MNEMQWYGDRYFHEVWDAAKLPDALEHPKTRVFIVDAKTFRTRVENRLPARIIARAGHLICFELVNSRAAGA